MMKVTTNFVDGIQIDYEIDDDDDDDGCDYDDQGTETQRLDDCCRFCCDGCNFPSYSDDDNTADLFLLVLVVRVFPNVPVLLPMILTVIHRRRRYRYGCYFCCGK
jgi:hypothetical protein